MEPVTFQTIIDDPRIIRAPNGVQLPQGATEVTLRSVPRPNNDSVPVPSGSTHDWMLEIVREIERLDIDLPTDLAENHDYYIHGKPRS